MQRLRYATYVAVFFLTTVMSSLNEKSTDQLGNRVVVRVRDVTPMEEGKDGEAKTHSFGPMYLD